MNLSVDFKQSAQGALALTPSFLAVTLSVYAAGPLALVPALVSGNIAYWKNRRAIDRYIMDDLGATLLNPPMEGIDEISKKMGVKKTPNLYVSMCSPYILTAFSSNKILSSGNLLNDLSSSEIQFCLAHEFAHIKRKDKSFLRGAALGEEFSKLSAIGGAFLFDQVTIPFYVASWALSALPSEYPPSMESDHAMEFDCDRRAVLATGNVEAAVSALNKAETFTDVGINEETDSHPSLRRRIEAIENLQPEVEKQSKNNALNFK